MRAQTALRRRIIVSAPQPTDAPDELDQGGWAGGCKGRQGRCDSGWNTASADGLRQQ